MVEDFKRVLARVQTDYDFYIRLQEAPEEALGEYNLVVKEKDVLRDPARLAGILYGTVSSVDLGDDGLARVCDGTLGGHYETRVSLYGR